MLTRDWAGRTYMEKLLIIFESGDEAAKLSIRATIDAVFEHLPNNQKSVIQREQGNLYEFRLVSPCFLGRADSGPKSA